MNRTTLKMQLSEAINIPKDVAFGLPIMRMIGREEFCMENYRGILEYTENMIRVQTKIGQVILKGKHLEITTYSCDEMKVTGLIHSVEYLEVKEG